LSLCCFYIEQDAERYQQSRREEPRWGQKQFFIAVIDRRMKGKSRCEDITKQMRITNINTIRRGSQASSCNLWEKKTRSTSPLPNAWAARAKQSERQEAEGRKARRRRNSFSAYSKNIPRNYCKITTKLMDTVICVCQQYKSDSK
jgi:hypothetical protein